MGVWPACTSVSYMFPVLMESRRGPQITGTGVKEGCEPLCNHGATSPAPDMRWDLPASMKTMFSKNSCDGYVPSRIFLNSLNHMLQWSSLKLIRSSVESFSLFGCSFVQMKRVIPRSVPWPDCFPEQRRFSFTENMPSSSMDSSPPGG